VGVIEVPSGMRRMLARNAYLREYDWSPDSRSVVYASKAGIFRVAVTGGAPQRLTTSRTAFGEDDRTPAWSPDGSTIAFVRGFSIYLMDADGSRERELVAGDEGGAPLAPAWSPDGSELAFSIERGRVEPEGKASIEAIRPDGTSRCV
jgi:TolB protein